MRKLRLLIAAVLLLCLLPVCSLAKGGSIKPWLNDIKDAKWGPVPEERLKIKMIFNNGNIRTRYYKNNGVLYHYYHGNMDKDCITNRTFSSVCIYPPDGAQTWIELHYNDIFLNDDSLKNVILEKLKQPDYIRDFNKGIPYYDWTFDLFDRTRNSERYQPKQLASEGKGNLHVAAWYDASGELITVDWVVETSDNFSIPKHNLVPELLDTFESEEDVPTPVEKPVLIKPVVPFPTEFKMMRYYYPSYQNNADFAELMLMMPSPRHGFEDPIPESEFEEPVVMYWPYPEGHSYTSNYNYKIKHYLDNTLSLEEPLDVTLTEKGLRIETHSFSPFELTWSEIEPEAVSVPETGDKSNVLLWAVLACVSMVGVAAVILRKKEA